MSEIHGLQELHQASRDKKGKSTFISYRMSVWRRGEGRLQKLQWDHLTKKKEEDTCRRCSRSV